MILILAAMQEEKDAILALMSDVKPVTHSNHDMISGQLENQSVLLALTGIGKVSTAMTLTSILEHFNIEEIINVGSAGGLGENQRIGDVVIADRGSFHDRYFSATPDLSEHNVFHCGSHMVDHLSKQLDAHGIRYTVGQMISGDQFLSQQTPHYQDVLKYFPNAISVDMESTTVMQVAQYYDVPVCIIRSLSDVPKASDHEGQFTNYLEFAADQSAKICQYYLSTR